MLSVFEFENYREFIKAWISTQESSHGLKSELAAAMGISSSFMSQVLKGDKSLTPEQAGELAERFGFTEAETDFWFLLIDLDRAGTVKLRSRLGRKIRQGREQAKSLSKRSLKDTELSDETKGVFYSSWLYSGIRNMAALPDVNDVPEIARRLNLPAATISKVVGFLVDHGLCRMDDGRLTYGPAHTFVNRDSPHVVKHHLNWRLQAARAMERDRDSDLFFTGPMSLSRETVDEIRKYLPQVIQEIYKKIGPSPSEQVACLNIDWFDYTS